MLRGVLLLSLLVHAVSAIPSVPAPPWGEPSATSLSSSVVRLRYCTTNASECGSGEHVRCAGGVCGCVASCFTYSSHNSSCALQNCFAYTDNVCKQPAASDRTVGIVLAVFLGPFGAPAWYVGSTLVAGVVLGVSLGVPVLLCICLVAAKTDGKSAGSCMSCVYGLWVLAAEIWMIVFAATNPLNAENCPLFG
jgi:hypothetical protein